MPEATKQKLRAARLRWLEREKIYERMHAEMVSIVRPCTVAIVAKYEGNYHHHATGTLIQIADYFFVVTASHAVKDYLDGKKHYSDLALYIDNGQRLVRLGGDYSGSSTSIDRESNVRAADDDLLDVVAWRLDPIVVQAVLEAKQKSFLNKASISPTADLSRGVFYLAGYPISWARTDKDVLHLQPLQFIGHPKKDTSNLPAFVPRLHLALNIDPTSREMPPKFKGISGCSIWRLSDDPPKANWTTDQARVVAIQTDVHTKSGRDAVQGTKWQYVCLPLMNRWPELRKAIIVEVAEPRRR